MREINSLAPVLRPLLERTGVPGSYALELMAGGGNNRVYRVQTLAGPRILKVYFQHAEDPRDRFSTERAFYDFAWQAGIRSIPRPLGWDARARVGLFEFVEGQKIPSAELQRPHVEEAAEFLRLLNRARPAAVHLPAASEASFSLGEHLKGIDARLERLHRTEISTDVDRDVAEFVGSELGPAWRELRASVAAEARRSGLAEDRALSREERRVSPSDFGFHNAVLASDGRVRFFDFEYAGWDDPAKTVCDFFSQPQVPVPREYRETITAALGVHGRSALELERRIDLLFPVYQLKWCCIRLNEFLVAGKDRRAFARGSEVSEDVKLQRLGAARAALDVLRRDWQETAASTHSL